MPYPNRTTVEGLSDSFVANEAIPIYSRVKFVAGVSPSGQARVEMADAADRAIGVTQAPVTEAGQVVAVELLGGNGEAMGISDVTVAAGVLLYGAANGRVSTASGGGALVAGTSMTNSYQGGRITYALHG